MKKQERQVLARSVRMIGRTQLSVLGVVGVVVLTTSIVLGGDRADFTPQDTGRIVIKFRPGVTSNNQAAILKSMGHKSDRQISQLQMHTILVPPNQTTDDVITRFARHPLIEFAEPDYEYEPALIPDDPWYGTAQWHLRAIGCPAAWDATTGSPGVTIAIIDTDYGDAGQCA